MKKRLTIIIIIILAAGAALFLSSYLREEKTNTVNTTGTVEGTEVNLASKVSGRIAEICCAEGDTVQKDSVAIRIDSNDIKASVEQATASIERAAADAKSAGALVESSRAEMNTADADIKNAEAEIEKARLQMEEAKLQMVRVASLYKENLVSKSDEDRAVTAFGALSAAYEASKAKHNAALSRKALAGSQLRYSQSQLVSAKARIKETEAGLSLQIARLDDTVIKTPVAGTIVFRSMEPGEFVSPGITILTVVDMENLRVRIDVEESLISSVTTGSEARITVDGIAGKVFSGKVSTIGRHAEFATQRDVRHGVQDLKTFSVEIRVEDKEKILKPGMTVNVELPKM